MPLPSTLAYVQCGQDKNGTNVQVAWEVHTLNSGAAPNSRETLKVTPTRLVLIMGFAASREAWYPLLTQLTRFWSMTTGGPLEVLLMDNRGVGSSSTPEHKSDYTTDAFAMDVLCLMDHLGWDACHVGGFSMGGMIATKLAAAAPERVKSLMLMGVTGGGSQIVPRTWKAFKYALKALFGPKTPESRARWDVKFHFSKHTLLRAVPQMPGVSVKQVLQAEYLALARSHKPQTEAGTRGQMHAVWTHSVTKRDVESVLSGHFPVWFVHGRYDLIATPSFAEDLAARFGAPCVLVNGAHFTPRENSKEVALLMIPLLTESGSNFAAAVGSAVSSQQARDSLEGLALRLHVTASGTLSVPIKVVERSNASEERLPSPSPPHSEVASISPLLCQKKD
mmetsp:Transcript_18336/g.31377  ORF Transcript_18336/g.31377 Transcript_18336/m.31377 type:complete len:393 (-) Transcript_18336:597-1775(-)